MVSPVIAHKHSVTPIVEDSAADSRIGGFAIVASKLGGLLAINLGAAYIFTIKPV
jgi:hypothetical protein